MLKDFTENKKFSNRSKFFYNFTKFTRIIWCWNFFHTYLSVWRCVNSLQKCKQTEIWGGGTNLRDSFTLLKPKKRPHRRCSNPVEENDTTKKTNQSQVYSLQSTTPQYPTHNKRLVDFFISIHLFDCRTLPENILFSHYGRSAEPYCHRSQIGCPFRRRAVR